VIGPDNPYAQQLVLSLILMVLLLLLTLKISRPARRYGVRIGIPVVFLFAGLLVVMH
jgi:hypothetical protein